MKLALLATLLTSDEDLRDFLAEAIALEQITVLAYARAAEGADTQLAGHVTVEDRAIISGLTAVHQFVRVGTHSFVGGMSRVAKDIPPYLKAVGNPVKLYGLNSVGLQRNNFDPEVIRELKRAYRLFFRSELNVSQALERAQSELSMTPEVKHFLGFVDNSQRGVVI